MDGYCFWKNVDKVLGQQKLISIAEKAGVNYRTIKNQRSGVRLPSLDDAFKIAKVLGVSLEYLLTGNQIDAKYPHRIENIVNACLTANEADLSLVERVLRIDSPSGEKSDTSSALA